MQRISSEKTSAVQNDGEITHGEPIKRNLQLQVLRTESSPVTFSVSGKLEFTDYDNMT